MTASATQPPPPQTSGRPGAASRRQTPSAPPPPVNASPIRSSGTRRCLDHWLWRLPVVLGLMAAACVALTFLAQQSARSVADRTAPALVDMQDLLASVAEANAAATSAHLSVRAAGTEDRASRGLYEAAVDRALAETVSTAATGASLDGLDEIGASIADYRAGIEAARIANLNGLPQADSLLIQTLSSVETEVEPAVRALTGTGQDQVDELIAEGTVFLLGAVGAAVLALIIMMWMQRGLAYRTRRILNRYLLAASLAVVAIVALLSWSLYVRDAVLTDALAGGYDSVTTTGELQSDAFALQSSLGLLLLDESQSVPRRQEVQTLIERLDGSVAAVETAADSSRERAAAETLAIRWQRYRETATSIADAGRRGDAEEGAALLQGQALSNFNGFNTGIESSLLDNRTQFLDGATAARQVVDIVPWVVLALSVVAALLSVAGIQQRRQDYR